MQNDNPEDPNLAIDRRLTALYNNHPSGFAKFWERVQKARIPTTRAYTKEFVNSRIGQQVSRPARRPKQHSTVWAHRTNARIQMDIVTLVKPPEALKKGDKNNPRKVQEYTSRLKATEFGGYPYALLVIDVKSRKVWGRLLKSRTGSNLTSNIQSIFNSMKKSLYGLPRSINADQEFAKLKELKRLAERENDIRIFGSERGESNKNSLIERFIRSFRELLRLRRNDPNLRARSMGENFPNTFKQIIKDHNESRHTATGEEPDRIQEGKVESKQGEPPHIQTAAGEPLPSLKRGVIKSTPKIKTVTYALNVGDYVRKKETRGPLDKSSAVNQYSEDIYRISRAERQSYFIRKVRRNRRMDNELPRPFRGYDLIEVPQRTVDEYFNN